MDGWLKSQAAPADVQESLRLTLEEELRSGARIKVVGVGGGGGNAVSRMVQAGLYVFDEVDTGVGGGMAEIIGRKIRSVAQHRQVLCITHLPQIAVFADQHFKVEKSVKGQRTASRVWCLNARERGEEIARMLGGVKITAKTRAVARELLKEARQSAA